MVRYLWIALGFIFLGLGFLGAVLPLVPTTPFLLLTVFFFSKGSERFSKWFVTTRIYNTYIASYRLGQAITLAKKIEILTSVTLVLGISFYFTEKNYLRLILISIFIGHLVYFGFAIKTKKKE
jgi:hypothetical protein